MREERTALHWLRISLAIMAAEAVPIVLLILIVVCYSATPQAATRSPEEFAPVAGNYVGPIGGFFSVLFFAWWAARPASSRQIAHGAAVGIGTALVDFTIGMMASAGGAVPILLYFSNGGRILAGVLGGWLCARQARQAKAA